MSTPTTANGTYTTDQQVIVRIPGGRERAGVFVGTTAEGKLTVRYENAKGEKTADFKEIDVRPAAVEEQPAPADEVPVVDVTDAEPEQGPHTQNECEDLDGCTAEHLPAEPVKDEAPAPRGKKAPLPEGWVTPVGLTRIINERGLYAGNAEGKELGGIYNPIAASEKAGLPFPGRYDYEGYKVIVEIEEGIAWYQAWTARQAERHENAAERRNRPVLSDEEKAARAQGRAALRELRAAEGRVWKLEHRAARLAEELTEAKAEAAKARETAAPYLTEDQDDDAEAEA